MDDGMTKKLLYVTDVTRISSIPNRNNLSCQMIEIVKLSKNKNNGNYDC
jgi:hypothetical protein